MWIFIDVPEAEFALAATAGAVRHRKSGLWFFDDKRHVEADFSRWRRIAGPDLPKPFAAPAAGGELSLHEVANLTGHTAKTIRALIEAGRFPKAIGSSGKSSRSDRWGLLQVKEWVERNGFGALSRLQRDDRAGTASEEATRTQAFYSIAEVAAAAHVASPTIAFSMLKQKGILLSSGDVRLNLRPADLYMKKGWFGRVERYLPSKDEWIFQTVVTALGYEAVVEVLRDDTAKGKK